MREFMMELKREQELTRIQLENGFQQGLERKWVTLAEKQLRIGETDSLPSFTQGEQDSRISQKKGRDYLVGSLLRFDEEQTVNVDRIYVASGKHSY
jgi:hypothetical protein